MRINVIFNKQISGYQNALEALEKALIDNKVEFKTFDIDSLEQFGNFTFVIGGDGTLLKCARFYAGSPVLGINLGRLGFLAQAGVEEIEKAVKAVIDGKYSTEERLMLASDDAIALNDFVIKGSMTSRTSKFYLEINDKIVISHSSFFCRIILLVLFFSLRTTTIKHNFISFRIDEFNTHSILPFPWYMYR